MKRKNKKFIAGSDTPLPGTVITTDKNNNFVKLDMSNVDPNKFNAFTQAIMKKLKGEIT